MSWLAVSNVSGAINQARQKLVSSQVGSSLELLVRGSLIIDLDFSLDQKAPCRLLHYTCHQGWPRSFTLYLNPDHTLAVEIIQGMSRSYASLANICMLEKSRVRITVSWDGPARIGYLTAEDLEDGQIFQVALTSPVPLPLADALAIASPNDATHIDPRVQHLALSDENTSVGPVPSFAAGAVVDTAEGPMPIERLSLGDLVMTQDNGPQPIRWILKGEMPAVGHTAPIRLRAPYFCLNRDLVVARAQRVMISGIETEYNLGQDFALIEADSLTHHPAVSEVSGLRSVEYYQILLDNQECVRVSGAWVDSLFIGRLSQKLDKLAQTSLDDVPPPILPIHRSRAHPVLRDYERQALLDTLIA